MSSIGSSSAQAPRPTISAPSKSVSALTMSVTELSQAKRTQALDANLKLT